MKRYLLIGVFLLVPSLGICQDGASNSTISIGSFESGGNGGTPSGNTDAIQFKVNSTTFGGSNWLTGTSNVIQLRPSSYLTENGPFRFNIDSATHDVGERRDDIFSMGWNVNNEAIGKGSTALVLEAYCGPSVGCPLPGQSETYFSLNDGLGNSTRPIGMFQSFDGTGFTSGIIRFDTLGFFDREQTYRILTIADNDGVGGVALGDSVLSSTVSSGPAFTINGQSAVALSSGNLQYGTGSANVFLSPGGDGSGIVRAASNHFQISSSTIENASGNNLIAFATDGPYIGFNGVDGDQLVYIAPGGPETNLGLMLQPKAAGAIRLNSGSTGTVYLQTGANQLLVGPFPGKTGVTVSGTSCTVTEITNGIITAATCTP